MIKVGITGQSGFMGTHLFNLLQLKKDEIQIIPFIDSFFEDPSALNTFVKQCDTIIHLAAMNRHDDPELIYDTNINLVKSLLKAVENTGTRPHIIFASSIHEDADTPYGRSKKEGRTLFQNWAEKYSAKFSGLIIPNVFGPFGHPYYNSVVATFSHQLTHNEQPRIEVDGQMKLIYVGELVDAFYKIIQTDNHNSEIRIMHTSEIQVSELLEKLLQYKKQYFENGIFPELTSLFEKNLFNTFRCYIDHKSFFPFKLKQNQDDRGSFIEIIKANVSGQTSFSITKPGITRGNHFHTRKIERFAVIKGQAKVEMRRIGTNEIISFELDGKEPSFVDMPIWYTHNITNIGKEDLYTLFWINEFFDPSDTDTFFEEV